MNIDLIPDDKTIKIKKILEALKGHANVLSTHKPEEAHERGRIDGWIEAHEYLNTLIAVMANLDPKTYEAEVEQEEDVRASWTFPAITELGAFNIPENILSQISREYAIQHKVLPLDMVDGILTLVIPDSCEPYEYDAIRFYLGMPELKFVMATMEQINRALTVFYPDPEATAAMPRGNPPINVSKIVDKLLGPENPDDPRFG